MFDPCYSHFSSPLAGLEFLPPAPSEISIDRVETERYVMGLFPKDKKASAKPEGKVTHIQYNPGKGATAVTFDDGKVIVVRRAEGQPDDIYFAVASAIAEHVYGSNTAFKKMIRENVETLNKKKKTSEDEQRG